MSILYSNEKGWIISHEQFLKKIYKKVKRLNENLTLTYDDNLFNINSKFFRQNQLNALKGSTNNANRRKRQKNNDKSANNVDEIKKIQEIYLQLLEEAKINSLFLDPVSCDFNVAARTLSNTFFDNTHCKGTKNLVGFNSCNYSQIVKLQDQEYVIPENSTFYCYNVKENDKISRIEEQFDFIVMDPPWWNKSVRRKRSINSTDSYSMLHTEELKDIPIGKLLKSHGIIVVWCTNSSNCMDGLLNDVFPMWNIKFIGKWYWVKVTKSGDTICDFNERSNKQPYELLLIGSPSELTNLAKGKMFLSIPSAVHSHKPPLIDIFKEYLPEKPKCLEIFARYLLPGWHSLGLEVLKFQQLSLFNLEVNKDSVHQ